MADDAMMLNSDYRYCQTQYRD